MNAIYFKCLSLKEVASGTLRNAHKENKRAKNERLFALYFLNYQKGLH